MTEVSLKSPSIEELFDLLMKSTKELISLTHLESTPEYEAKKKEVQLLQRIIVEKRTGLRAA